MADLLKILPFQMFHKEQELFLENQQTISLQRGELVLVSGANGSGKSHLLQLIKGIIPQIIEPNQITRHCVLYEETSIENLTEDKQYEIAYLGQLPYTGFVIDEVRQDLWFSHRGLHSNEPDRFQQEIYELLNRFEILHLLPRKNSSLSSGEQQLLNICRLLLQRPKILLLDEFGEYLSNDNIRKVLDYLQPQMAEMLIIVVDHNPFEIQPYITKRIIIKDRQLLLESVIAATTNPLKTVQPALIPAPSRDELNAIAPTANSLNIKDLSFSWQRSSPNLLSNINISIRPQQIIGIYGNNSSGKSTLLQILIKQLSPTMGIVEIFGQNIRNIPAKTYFKTVNILFTNSILHFFEANICQEMDNLKFSAEMILTRINLIGKKHLHFSALSNGEQKRLALATVLFSGAKLMLLEEPFLGQDQQNKAALDGLIQEVWQNSNATIVVVSNKMAMLPQNLHQLYKL